MEKDSAHLYVTLRSVLFYNRTIKCVIKYCITGYKKVGLEFVPRSKFKSTFFELFNIKSFTYFRYEYFATFLPHFRKNIHTHTRTIFETFIILNKYLIENVPR